MAPGAKCGSCGGAEIETDVSRGVSFCTGCGSVLESDVLVSDVQFQENAFGANSVVGQTVHFDGRGGLTRGCESRAVTLETGRRLIVEVSEQLRIHQHLSDTAFNWYKMAVGRGLTRGRPRYHTVAACLYIACRLGSTTSRPNQHMLLDFSEALQVNVWELGRCYVALANAFHINLPSLDPVFYLSRFAHLLQLGDKANQVVNSAVRLLQRMKKDWMHVGRRPSGLCGAALLMAARLHDFNRTPEDMVKVVRIGSATIRKRLMEFGATPAAKLTLDQFQSTDLEGEMDPPSFTNNRKKDRLKEEEEEEEKTKEMGRLQREIERLLDEKHTKLKEIYESSETPEGEELDEEERESLLTAKFIEEETISAINKFVDESREPSPGTSSSKEEDEASAIWNANFSGEAVGNIGLRAAGLLDAELTGTELYGTSSGRKRPREEEEPEMANDGVLDLTGIDDKEIDTYIMSAKEIENKSAMWHVVNADYLKELQEKEERMAELEKEGLPKPEKKKRQMKKRSSVPFSSAGEAIETMLKEKRISSKINYDVLRALNPSAPLPVPPPTPPLPVTNTPGPVPEPKKTTSEPTKKIKLSNENESGTSVSVPEPVIKSAEEMPLVVEEGPITYNDEPEDDYHEDESEEDEDGYPIERRRFDDDGFEDYDDDD